MRQWTTAATAASAMTAGLFGAAFYTARMARKAEAAVPMDGELVDVGHTRLHVTDTGRGQPLLLIHGLAGQMRNFAASLEQDLARDYRVIKVDRPGSGYSPRLPDGRAHLGAQADAIAALIDSLGLERPVLVGHSLGGALSLAVAIRHPDKVGALALIAPATQPVEAVPTVFKGLVLPPALLPLVAWTLATPLGVAGKDKALKQVFAPEPVPDNFLVDGGGMLGFRPGNFQGAAADLADALGEAAELVAAYPRLNLPVGILYGRGDHLLDYRVHGERSAAQIPGAQLTLTEGGHMLPFTQPETTARFIRGVAERV